MFLRRSFLISVYHTKPFRFSSFVIQHEFLSHAQEVGSINWNSVQSRNYRSSLRDSWIIYRKVLSVAVFCTEERNTKYIHSTLTNTFNSTNQDKSYMQHSCEHVLYPYEKKIANIALRMLVCSLSLLLLEWYSKPQCFSTTLLNHGILDTLACILERLCAKLEDISISVKEALKRYTTIS